MRVGINLLWVRPGKNGGTESYIRNILDGLSQFARSGETYCLYVSRNNRESFEKYFSLSMFEEKLCPVDTSSQAKRIVWETLHLYKAGLRDKLDLWFMPVYSRPLFLPRKIPCITTIHDIQGMHYPEYFSKARMLYFKVMWKWACKKSDVVLTISNFCKDDLLKHYKISSDKVQVIYNPIITNESGFDFSILSERYGISDRGYLYTVSALAKHKNLITVLKAMKLLKKQGANTKLLITGVKVNAQNEIVDFVKNNNLDDVIVFTGYISDEERDCLYDHCRVFLFPSVFEGFGMPPIEAMRRGVPVLTTKETSLYEVTRGKAEYTQNPYDAEEWASKIEILQQKNDGTSHPFEEYNLDYITNCYRNLFVDTIRARHS